MQHSRQVVVNLPYNDTRAFQKFSKICEFHPFAKISYTYYGYFRKSLLVYTAQ